MAGASRDWSEGAESQKGLTDPATGSGRYTQDEQELLTYAKKKHRETTDSAERAAQTALRTREVANDTLSELQRQGQKLNVIEHDLNEIDADVKEAKGILAYMRRCCLCFLFSCCCDCDPSKEADATRTQRVEMRKDMRKQELEMYANAQPKQYQHSAGQAPGPEVQRQRSEAAQRDELLGKQPNGQAQAGSPRQRKWQIGEHLEDKDKDELALETAKQDRYLDIVGEALGDLTRAAKDMNEELEVQDKQLEGLQSHAGRTLDDLNEVETTTRRDFKLREDAANKRAKTRQKYTPNVGRLMTGAAAAKGAVGGGGGGDRGGGDK